MCKERRGSGLPVRSGNPDIGCVRLRAEQKFDVAGDIDLMFMCELDHRMRLGMRERHARRNHQMCKARPWPAFIIEDFYFIAVTLLCIAAAFFAVIPCIGNCAARNWRNARRPKARTNSSFGCCVSS